ncbi:alpha-2-macroglobulin family protein [Lichenibacterium ramalinae]|uniref:Alpha-2-macroglobulin family protein n=1 Tax=Lichenibacterium ramalinae TaxID=2316527 RepID=A0A4V1RIF7_9HYPH|nr:alpha-2-macroglobulin [Lichenibacterium ramalinae]RYB03656.1 alpha-2-macroglobulin family protein [Lichenibacterium ramalinae]
MRRLALTLALLSALSAPAPAQQAAAPATLAPKSFDRPDLAAAAQRLKAEIKAKSAADADGRSAADSGADLAAAAAKAPPGSEQALKAYAAAIAAGRDGAAIWLGLATAAEAVSAALPDTDERRDSLARWVMPAAYASYLRATTRRDEAAALALGGASMARQEQWRPALDADRASLAAREDPKLRAAYEALRDAHGFHVADYSVDADAVAPRICLQFSEDLKGSAAELAPYVTVAGQADPALSAKDRQLCVEGLEHGQTYHVAVRTGLPSTVGEALTRPADYDVFVPDRPARIATLGQGYVLPRVGAEGIPLLSVNVARIDVSIVHIGDRNLVATLRAGNFRNQIGDDDARRLAEEEGRQVWSGSLAVAAKLNADVKTAFPVREAVGALAPGVYVLQARLPATGAEAGRDGRDGASATQWFVVSDLGLSVVGGEGGITALVRSLATAAPVPGVTLTLLARDNGVLGTAVTGADGAARFDPGLSRGEGGARPALLTAAAPGGDTDFLDLTAAPFDLTDRGDKGRPAKAGLDALVYAERGVYRPGETVSLTALLRDAAGTAVPGLPLTLVVSRPDGVESRRVQVPDGGIGGHSLAVPLLAEAASGTWNVAAYADPKGKPVGETTFLVEDYVPERLTLALTPAAPRLRPGQPAEIRTETRFLYGAPGAGLAVTGDSTVEAAPGPAWPTLDGYQAGLTDEAVESATTALPEPVTTAADGTAAISVPVAVVTATRPLQARIALRVAEPGGRALERGVTIPILPATGLIGVRATGDGAAAFDVVTVDAAGQRSAVAGLHWRLTRDEHNFQWYKTDEGHWRFERVDGSKLVAEGRIDTAAAAPAHLSVPASDGHYRLDVTAPDQALPDAGLPDGGLPATAVGFDIGFGAEAGGDSPDRLGVTLDRADYRPGDTMRVTVASRFAGHATLLVGQNGIAARREMDLAAGDTVVTLPVEAAWGPGAYAMVLAQRPLDAPAKRMPGRAVGLAWFAVGAAARDLKVELGVPALARPRAPLHVPVRLAGLKPGEPAAVTVAAVDAGILNLTRYEAPKPGAFFFGQRMLGLDLRDIYGGLIDGLGVAAGAIRQGGDAGLVSSAEAPTQPPLARYSGIVPVGPDGTATVDFDIPAFNGTLRVSAVAWSRTGAGSAEADVVLRDPVVVTASLPRFLSVGDRARLRVDIDDVEGPAGEYRLALAPRGPWFLPADALDRTVALQPGARGGFDVPVTAAGLGVAGLSLRLTGPGGLDLSQEVALGIAPGAPAVYRRVVHPLTPGQGLTLSRDLLADFVPGTGRVSLAVSPLGDIDVPALLLGLDRYPVGCSEQVVSRALPLLGLDRLAPPSALMPDGDLKPRLAGAVAQLLARQTAEGGFGLWTAEGGGGDPWLDAYVTDFLTRAREAGFAVPPRALDAALDRLRNTLAAGTRDRSAAAQDRDLALGYAGYVLARNGRPVMADLRYIAGERLDALASPLAKAQLAAALALLGDRPRAAATFAAATAALDREPDDRGYRQDYGSRLRDAAAVLTLAADAGLEAATAQAGEALSAAQRSPYPRNTQEQAWLVLAAQALQGRAQRLALDVDGARHAGPLYRDLPAARLDAGPLALVNAGPDTADVVVTTSGQLPAPEPEASHGYAVERRYVGVDGREVDPAHVAQTTRLVVVLKVAAAQATQARLLLTDPLPAGFEIDNPALVADGVVPGLKGLDVDAAPSHTEFRDDRFTAAFERAPSDPPVFTVAYTVRAVTPGRFVHPPAVVEDMYRPERFGRTGNGIVEVAPAR